MEVAEKQKTQVMPPKKEEGKARCSSAAHRCGGGSDIDGGWSSFVARHEKPILDQRKSKSDRHEKPILDQRKSKPDRHEKPKTTGPPPAPTGPPPAPTTGPPSDHRRCTTYTHWHIGPPPDHRRTTAGPPQSEIRMTLIYDAGAEADEEMLMLMNV
ncbi:hypothetical protein LXL04_014618 [Taraxacum kok-saghyz]